ncbi:hypothetical protein R1flu_008745 [Riccia fluitans]|uniref:Reverse transcriptase zinc-binding domain-containing protein n=1 Tax=Riccia fluitans TaxID=41844 RepID=A0ABD1YD89_9MARC
MRYVGHLLNGDLSDWAQMMKYFIQQQMQRRSNGQETKYWTAEEVLILLPSLAVPQSETTNSMIQSWLRLRRFLTLDEDSLDIPSSLTLRQIKIPLERYRARRSFNDRVVFPILRRLGVQVLINLADGAGKWVDLANRLRVKGILLNQVQSEAIGSFQEWLSTVRMEAQRLQDSASWRLKGTRVKWKGWTQSSQAWHKLISAEETMDDLSSKWPEANYEYTWKERWKKLWGKGGAPRIKLWTWKILRRAFFTGERAKKMQVSTDPCCHCKIDEETVPHLFFNCRDS